MSLNSSQNPLRHRPFDESRGRFIDRASRTLLIGAAGHFEKTPESVRLNFVAATPRDASKFRTLRIRPTSRQVAACTSLPVEIALFTSLQHLEIPFALTGLDWSGTPRSLKLLQLSWNRGDKIPPEKFYRWAERWDENDALTGLFLEPTVDPSLFRVGRRFLRRAAFFIGSAPRARVGALSEFDSIQHLELHDTGAGEALKAVAPCLRHLYVTGLARGFAWSTLSRFAGLQSLFVVGARDDVDLSFLANLRGLTELLIWGAPRLTKIDSLLQSPSVRFLELVNCGRSLAPANKATLQNRGMDFLNVNFE